MARKLMFGLSDAVIGDLRGVFAKYPEIERVLIFGSRAKGTFKDGSDIDLAVVAPAMSDQRFTQLWGEIDDLQLVFKVDVVHFDRLAQPALREEIMANGQSVHPPS